MKLLSILKKDFLSLFNSKLTLIMMIFGPLILILVIGLGLSGGELSGINGEVIAGDSLLEGHYASTEKSVEILNSNDFTKQFIGLMRSNGLTVTYSTLDRCMENLKDGETHVCIVFNKDELEMPETDIGYSKEELESVGISYSLDVYLDFSKQRTVSGIIGAIDSLIQEYSSKIREEVNMNINDIANKLSLNLDLVLLNVKNIKNNFEEIEEIIESLNPRNLDEQIESIDDEVKEINAYLSNIENNLNAFYSLGYISSSSYYETLGNLDNIKSSLTIISSSLENLKTEVTQYERLNSLDFNYLNQNINDLENDLEKIQRDMVYLENLDLDSLLYPIPTEYKQISDSNDNPLQGKLKFIDYLYPTFISFFIMLISLMFSSTIALKEKLSKGYIRSMLSKVSQRKFIISNLLISSFIILFELAIILIISQFFLSVEILINIPMLIALFISSTLCFAMLGILIGNLFSSFEGMSLSVISISLGLMMFSSLISPLETLSPFIRNIMSFSPLIILEEAFRRVLLFNSGFTDINLLSLVKFNVYLVVFFIITLFVKKSKIKKL